MVTNLNQVRQIYVADAYNASVSEASNPKTIGVDSISDGVNKEMFFVYKGADTVLKSDRIPIKNLDYIKVTKAADLKTKLKKVEVTLSTDVNGGEPLSGQDYVLRIAFRQWIGMSDQDQYFKDAAVHATANMSASDFYKAMVKALNLSFSRELGATKDSNPYLSFSVDNTTTATKLIIEEKPQAWTLGVGAQERVYFDVIPTVVYFAADDAIWGTVTEVTPTTTIGNGKKIADLEYFLLGERGDQYRNIGWPNNIDTKYLVNPDLQYHVMEIHYAFTDTGVNSYRTEKDITIVVSGGADGTNYTAINAIIDAVNTAAGTTIASLS